MTINMAVPFTLVLWVLCFVSLGCRDLHIHIHVERNGQETETIEITSTDFSPSEEEILIEESLE